MSKKKADKEGLQPDKDAAELLPVELIARFMSLPMRIEESRLHVCMVAEGCPETLGALKEATGFNEIAAQSVSEDSLREWLDSNHNALPALDSAMQEPGAAVEFEGWEAGGDDDDARRVLASLLSQCHARGAARLVIESLSVQARARIRFGESLETLLFFPNRLLAQMTSALSACLSSDATPNGVMNISVGDAKQALHCVSVDTTLGTSSVLHLSDPTMTSLAAMAFTEQQQHQLSDCLKQPSGLIVLVGTHGAGLTSIALALAAEMASGRRLTYLVSDDLHASQEHLHQLAVRPDLPMDQQLRGVMRHQPDALLLDLPGSSLAFNAALDAAMAGCLVVATVKGARVMDLLSDPQQPAYQLASTTLCVVAQHLCRRVCDDCAQGYEPTEAILKEFSIPSQATKRASFRRGQGCSRCHGSGFRGVIALREMLLIDGHLRALIRDRANAEAMLEHAREQGFYTLWETGILKVMKGETTLEELRSLVTQSTG